MAGASLGHSLHRPCSGRKTLRKCQNNVKTDNVVFIEVDDDDLENVIVIDSPELISKKLGGLSESQDKQHQRRVIICIDDEESTDNEHCDIEVKKRCNFSSGASSNKGPNAAAENHDKFPDEVRDDCESIQEIMSSPVPISKCKRTYSGKVPPRKRYSLGPESDDFFNDEFLDCELVEEDFSGSVREQWEKAFSERKYENRNDHTGPVGCKTYKASHKSSYCGEKIASAQPNEPADFSSSKKVGCEKAGPSPSTATWKVPQFTIFTSKRRSLAVPVSKSVFKEHAPYNKANSDCGSNPLAENASKSCVEDQYDHNLECDGWNFPNAEPKGSSFNPRHSAVEVDPVTESSQVREKSETMKEDSSRPQVHQEQAPEGSAAQHITKSLAFSISSKTNYKRKISSPLCEIGNSREPSSKRGYFGGHVSNSVEDGWSPHNKTSSHSVLDHLVEKSKMNCGESQYHHNFKHHNPSDRALKAEKPQQPWRLQNYVNEVVPLHERNDDLLGSAESCMISDREKLKETDEYKKAIEEDWASRRHALQIQADEAKKLRLLQKRENAERLRLLDMERRQKQRVEEIRENMQKDEEQMNMKDLIRAEVRNELSKVEITCCDMASLLRCLGIQVGRQIRPNADEVRAACKRALFAFHPDRASKSNTRQQVEAEEKFKLISRMKEKFFVA